MQKIDGAPGEGGGQIQRPAVAAAVSEYTVARVSRHLPTDAWLIGPLGLAEKRVKGEEDRPGGVMVSPR